MVETQLNGIAEKARRCPEERFTSLAHLLNEEHLKHCFEGLKAHKAAGVDGVTKEEYAKALDSNIVSLVSLMKQHAFRPAPSRRVYIPKAGSDKKRPLGIPTLESKLVQMAMRRVLDRIYEAVFLDSSFGFRPGRSAHGALKKVDTLIRTGQYHWVVEVDIEGFFDSVNHEHLMKFLKMKIADPNILRLIVRFLKAGIWEEGQYLKTDTGTPQGGVISPLLANIYLHYVLDLWFERRFRRQCRGEAYLFRYADDFVVCFQYREEAERFLKELKDRLEQFHLEVEPTKTKLLRFGRFARQDEARDGKEPETFDFLGFTHHCGNTRAGVFKLQRRTSKKKFRAKLRDITAWIRRERHQAKAGLLLRQAKRRLQGHLNYYAITDNSRLCQSFRDQFARLLFKWLNRRSQRDSYTWEQFSSALDWVGWPSVRIQRHLDPFRRVGLKQC